MNNKSAINIVGILLLYFVWAAIICVLPMSMLGPTGDMDQQVFHDLFQRNVLIVTGVSMFCMLVWFALGEWSIPAWAPPRTWYLTWFVILIVTIGTSIYMSFQGPQGGSTDPVNYSVATFYFIGGILSYYAASVCFSPTNAKYAIWPAKLIRRW